MASHHADQHNVVPLHRGVSPRTGEQLSRLTKDRDAVYVRGVRREIGEFDKVLRRQRNAEPRVSEGAWLLIGSIVALTVLFSMFAEQIDAWWVS